MEPAKTEKPAEKAAEDDDDDDAAKAFAAAIAAGRPRVFRGATMRRFPLAAYAAYGDGVGCDGGPISVRCPHKPTEPPRNHATKRVKRDDGSAVPWVSFRGDDEAATQTMTLRAFLALADSRENRLEFASSTSSPSPSAKQQQDDLYACQVPLDAESPRPLAAALAAGAACCLPSFFKNVVSPDRYQLNAWLCASARASRTEAHWDGYHNLMCVLEGEKTVELWAPRALTAAAPWNHYYDGGDLDLKKPDVVLAVPAGDAAFWPEGWWHRVTSAPLTRAVNAWWRSDARDAVSAIPITLVPVALRTLAHRLVEADLSLLAPQDAKEETCSGLKDEDDEHRARRVLRDALRDVFGSSSSSSSSSDDVV